ncbi:hypothetical protein [Agarivorans sp.]|uniref:hypothetical protein n=1 Tax=Agarivorans sp. TaxID=1872412 RepID=UPI003D07676B
MDSGAFSLNDEELALLLAPNAAPASSKLLRVLWFQYPSQAIRHSIEHIYIKDFDELQLQLQHSNEFDALIINSHQLSSEQLGLLADVLEEQSQISVFLVGKLPNMAFDLPDFTYCASPNELLEQFNFWCDTIKQQYQDWASHKTVYLYNAQASKQIEAAFQQLSFTHYHQWQCSSTLPLAAAQLLVLVIDDDDPQLVETLETLTTAIHRPGVIFIFAEHSRLKSSIILFAKQYGLNLLASATLSQFQQQLSFLSRQFFRRYRHRLNQLALNSQHYQYLITATEDSRLLGAWDWPNDPAYKVEQASQLYAVYWHRYDAGSLTSHIDALVPEHQKHKLLLVFNPDFPTGDISTLIRIKQQQVKLAWQPELMAQLNNAHQMLDLLDVLVITLDMWVLLNQNSDNQLVWQEIENACQLQQVRLAILGGQLDLISDWRDKGFDLLVHRDDAEPV